MMIFFFFFGLHRECLGLARLVFQHQGHDDLSLFVQTLIYQRRKNLKEMQPEEVPSAGIEWGNSIMGFPDTTVIIMAIVTTVLRYIFYFQFCPKFQRNVNFL